MKDKILEAVQISKTYGEGESAVQALKASDLTIWKGEFASIIGSSGSGKSTLLKILGGLLPPTTGNVLLDGQDIYDEGYDMKALRSKVGLVFQYPDHQLFETTCFEDVCFGPKNQGLSPEECEKRAREALQLVGLKEKYFDHSPFDLSGGQKRRAAIAGVLAMRPKVLVLDEPTAGMDAFARRQMWNLLKKLNQQKLTILLTTHYMEEAIYADRVFVMDQGKVALQGTPHEVFSNVDKMKELHLDVPEVTLLADELRKAGMDLPAGILTREELAQALGLKKNGRKAE